MYSKNAWNKYSGKKLENLFAFNEDYKNFISKCKTERECVCYAVELAKQNGFKDLSEYNTLQPGDKVYATNMGKNICVFVVGEEPIVNGLNILGAHIDSPRVDIKQNPVYEKNDFVLLDTHYYGGIVKYQWVTTPLAIHGVVVKKDGSVINVVIGEDEKDPVFVISDLLPHLAAEKMQKSGAKVIEGEDLDVTFASIPLDGEEKDAVKKNLLNILKEKYDFDEEDFLSSELEVVPAGKARDLGLDKSLILGYGHDDRVCAYTSLRAVLDTKMVNRTACAYLVDKEEVGSIGATGAHSKWFENVVAEMIAKQERNYNDLLLRRAITNSLMLSSDVSAGYDPLYSSVFEAKNAAYLGKGLTFNKYTGSRGKSGCNDALPEFFAEIRNVMDTNDINYQTAELGRVDVGGGGTIAYIMGNMGMKVIDAGIPVLSMHAPNETVSKVDVFEAYKGYIAFVKDMK